MYCCASDVNSSAATSSPLIRHLVRSLLPSVSCSYVFLSFCLLAFIYVCPSSFSPSSLSFHSSCLCLYCLPALIISDYSRLFRSFVVPFSLCLLFAPSLCCSSGASFRLSFISRVFLSVFLPVRLSARLSLFLSAVLSFGRCFLPYVCASRCLWLSLCLSRPPSLPPSLSICLSIDSNIHLSI